MWTRPFAASTLVRIGFLTSILVCLLAVTSSRANSELSGRRFDMGLLTTYGGRVLAVTVTEVGAPDVSSFVRITVLNESERVIFRADRVLKRGQPARLELPFNPDLDRVLVRVSIDITGTPGRLSTPIAVVEDLDPLGKTAVPRGFCSQPGGRNDPVVPFCPGWEVTDILAP
jgi:hypothetical protein